MGPRGMRSWLLGRDFLRETLAPDTHVALEDYASLVQRTSPRRGAGRSALPARRTIVKKKPSASPKEARGADDDGLVAPPTPPSGGSMCGLPAPEPELHSSWVARARRHGSRLATLVEAAPAASGP